jgi:hypothetical protein
MNIFDAAGIDIIELTTTTRSQIPSIPDSDLRGFWGGFACEPHRPPSLPLSLSLYLSLCLSISLSLSLYLSLSPSLTPRSWEVWNLCTVL